MRAKSIHCRPAIFVLAMRLVHAAGFAFALLLGAYAPQVHAADPYIFEGSAAGSGGGGVSLASTYETGYTFRVTQRVEVTEVGAQLSLIGSNSYTVYMALHRVGTPISTPDVVSDSNLIATTLLTVDPGGNVDHSAPLSATLEPGWYAITVGTGRHAATAPNNFVTVDNTGNATPLESWGPYSARVADNSSILQGVELRMFVRGNALPPTPPDPDSFLMQTTEPYATWGNGFWPINATHWFAARFDVTRTARVGRVGGWFYNSASGGRIFAAIVHLASPSASLPQPGTPGFANAVLSTTTIDVGAREKYSGLFNDVVMVPGSYALVFGTGQYSANGTASLQSLDNTADILSDAYQWNGSAWFPGNHVRLALEGIVPQIEATPDPVVFASRPLGLNASQQMTVTNVGVTDVTVGAIGLTGADATQFSVDADASQCSGHVLAAQATCSFTLHYQPAVVGSHAAQVTIASDGVPNPLLVPVTGEALLSHTVTPSAGANGTITPSTAQIVADGSQASFDVSPDVHYHVDAVGGSCGGSLSGSTYTTDPVIADCSVTAGFAIDSYTLSYVAGPNGSIAGTTPQAVDYGASGTPITAVPAMGYHFVDWSDGRTDNPRTDVNVSADLTVTANFAIDSYTLNYVAGPNGSITGTTPQTVDYGASGTPVTAVPAVGHHFVDWSDGRTDSPRTDANVSGDITVTANFAIDSHTLTYLAGSNGSITGTTPQTVDYGASGTPVTAAPATGYHFVSWSDSRTDNPRTDVNVSADLTVTANFAIDSHTLTYLAGPNGSITGTTPQTIDYGASGSPVTAAPATGYHFVDWSDGRTDNPRTDVNVSADLTVTANFAIDSYTLSYVAGPNGSITGTTPQTIDYGASGTPVTAAPATGYHFADWSDGRTDNPRTDVDISADLTVTANFTLGSYTLSYLAGPNGSITGTTPQTVDYGASGTSVTAVPATGYHFVDWSDGSTDNPRTDVNVSVDLTVTANFAVDAFTVSVEVSGEHGSITPTTQTVDYGASVVFTLTPDSGYRVDSVTGCGGTRNGNAYLTGPISADCTVTASFAPALQPSTPVPAAGWKALLILAGSLGCFALIEMRRRRKTESGACQG